MTEANEIQSHSEVIDVLGGQSAVARVLGLNASSVSEMKRRGNIPPEYWPALVVEARAKGRPDITSEALAICVAKAKGRLPAIAETDPAV